MARQSNPARRIEIPWRKQPRQIEFLRACGLSHPFEGGDPQPPKAEVILYGGAAGGGKSDALLMAGIIACLSYPKCTVGYFRREYPDLEGPEGAIHRSQQLLAGLAKWNGQLRRWKFPNGSLLQFCHCAAEKDVHGYQSQAFAILLFDEATQFTPFQLRYLRTRNRTTVKGITPFTAMASNPGGASHAMIREQYVDPGIIGQPFECEVEPEVYETHMYIPAKLSDNSVLVQADPGYRKRLESQPEDIRRALADGDWTVFAGQYFRAFRRDRHVIEPFEIPRHWQRFGSLDWGYAVPHCILWHAVDPANMRVYTYREHYAAEMRASEVAEVFVELSAGEKIRYLKASPDMWQERGLGSKADPGKTAADEFLDRKVRLEPADNRRVLGWGRCREYLADGPDELPWWQVFDTCVNLIRTIPQLIHDKRNVEDVSGDGEDHAPEAWRYALMSVEPPPSGQILVPGRVKTVPKQWHEWPDERDEDDPRRGKRRSWM